MPELPFNEVFSVLLHLHSLHSTLCRGRTWDPVIPRVLDCQDKDCDVIV